MDGDLADLALLHFRFAIVQADDLHFHVGQGHSNRTGLVHSQQRIAMGRGRRLGESISLEHPSASQVFKLFFCLPHQWGRARDAGLDRRKIVFSGFYIGVIIDPVIQQRHTGEDRRFVFADVFQHIFQIAGVGHHDHTGAHGHRQAHPGDHPVDMEQGNAHQEDFLSVYAVDEPGPHLFGVRHDIAVHSNRALRDPGCSAGVLE